MREVNCAYFIFDIVNKKCSPISLSETEANMVTADRDELRPSVRTNLIDGEKEGNFFASNGLSGCSETIFTPIIDEIVELRRKSICNKLQLLRNPKKLDRDHYKH